jgi:hypothetical protein
MTTRKGHIALVMLWVFATLGWAPEVLSAAPPDGVTTHHEEPGSYNFLGHEGPPKAPIVLLGIVVAVDQTEGSLVLGHGDGTRSTFNTDPWLLRKVQIGDPVKVVAEGSTVRTLEPLGPFSLQA